MFNKCKAKKQSEAGTLANIASFFQMRGEGQWEGKKEYKSD